MSSCRNYRRIAPLDISSIRHGLLYELRLTSTYAVNKTFVRIPITNMTHIAINRQQKVVLMYDYGPCFWVANGTSVHGRTGGEFVWCSSILGQLLDTGRTVYVTNTSALAKRLSKSAHMQGTSLITIAHWGWQEIALSTHKTGRNHPVKSIGSDCLIKMNYWGTMQPTEVWPGQLKRYISLYPLEQEKVVAGREKEQVWSCGRRKVANSSSINALSSVSSGSGSGGSINRATNSTAGVNTGVGLGDQFTHCGSDLPRGNLSPTGDMAGETSPSRASTIIKLLQHRIQTSPADRQLWELIRGQLSVESEWYKATASLSLNKTASSSSLVSVDRTIRIRKSTVRQAMSDGTTTSASASASVTANATPTTPTPYYIIYGKWGVVKRMTADKKVFPMFRNSTLWTSLSQGIKGTGLRGVVLTCDDKTLFPTLKASPDLFLCVHPESIFKRAPLYNLLLERASFLLGVGAPYLSTTPYEAMACQTKVVLPVGQHNFLDKCGGGGSGNGSGSSSSSRSVASGSSGGSGNVGVSVGMGVVSVAKEGGVQLFHSVQSSDELLRVVAQLLSTSTSTSRRRTGSSRRALVERTGSTAGAPAGVASVTGATASIAILATTAVSGTAGSKSRSSVSGSSVTAMFDGMKEDFRGLLEEVEDTCMESMKGYRLTNQSSSTATTAARGSSRQQQRSSLFQYIVKTFGWSRNRSADDDG